MNTPRKWGWWLSGLLLLATLLNYMDRQALVQVSTLLKTEIHLDNARYGRLERSFSWSFAIGSIVFGLLVDRVGPKHLYPFALLGWSLAGCACGLAGQPIVETWFGDPNQPAGYAAYHWLFLCRTMLGFFEAGHWPCALVTLRNVLGEKDRPFGNSLLQSGASLGAVITPLLIQAMFALNIRWPVAFAAIGILGLFWIPAWYALLRPIQLMTADQPKPPTEPVRVGKLFVQMALLSGLVISMGLTWQFHRAWLPKFLKENQGYSEWGGNLITSGYYIAADLGCLLSGAVATLLCHRAGMRVEIARLIAFVGCVICAGLSVFATAVPAGPLQVALFLFVGAGTLGLHPHYYALAQELPRRHMGVLSGLLAASTWFCVGEMQRRIGQQIKDTGDYTPGMIFAGLAPLAGLLCMAILVFVPWITRKTVSAMP